MSNIDNKEYLEWTEVTLNISIFIRVNLKFCESIGPSYSLYFDRCFGNIIAIYNDYWVLA